MKNLALLVPFSIAALIWAQDLPEGNGKKLVQEVCSGCHGLDIVVAQKATKEGWQSIVDYMIQRGASAKEDEIALMVEYLAKNFPKEDTKK
jgi:competence protein ComEA